MPTYRISSIGECPRVLSAIRLGYEPLPEPEWLAVVAREGTRHETWIVSDLQEQGWQIEDRQQEVSLSYAAFDLVGHIDGKARMNGDKSLLEIKTMSRFVYARWLRYGFKAFPEYADQVTVYHKAEQLPIMYVVKCRDTGELDITHFAYPPSNFDDVFRKVLSVEAVVLKGNLYPALREEVDKCRTCNFRYLCPRETKITERPSIELQEAIVMRKQAMALEHEAEELRTRADPTLLTAAKEHGSRLTVSGLAITYVAPSERVSYPAQLLRKVIPAELLEQARQVQKTKEYIRVQELV